VARPPTFAESDKAEGKGIRMRNHEPDYKFGANEMNAEYRKESIALRHAELDLERSKADRELRRWCIENVGTKCSLTADGKVAEADKIYNWVRNKPKADAA
jgi:hypothetical protein